MELKAHNQTLIDFPAAARGRSRPKFDSQGFLPRLVKAIDFQPDAAHRCIMVAHLFDDTMRMLDALAPLTRWDAVIGVPYSSQRPGLRERWGRRFADKLHLPADLSALDAVLTTELARALAICAAKGQRLIVQDVGGFAVPLLQTYFADQLHLVKGVIEITKQGVWRAAALPPRIAVLHCAESELKRLEAVRCGETVARCLDGSARGLGKSLAGRHAVVMGAGWIGAGVARALRRFDMTVAVVDPDPLKVLEARLDGYAASLLPEGLSRAALIVGATGRLSITPEMLATLPDGALVASASSRRVEIDTDWLERHACEPVEAGLDAYTLGEGRRILLVNGGFPANFLPGSASVADEVVEAILGELIVLQQALTMRDFPAGLHAIEPTQEAACARLWLAMRDAPLGAA